MYKRPSARLDRLNLRAPTSGVPVLISGFSQAIREHEHQIADLVLSICARALANGESSLERAVAAIANRDAGQTISPRDLVFSPFMSINVLDSGLLADLLLSRTGTPRSQGVAEGLLTDYGWREVQHWSSLVNGVRVDGKPTFHRAALWSPARSQIHGLSGTALYRALDEALRDQILDSRLLALPHIHWHSTLALAYLQDARGEVVIVPSSMPGVAKAHQRASRQLDREG